MPPIKQTMNLHMNFQYAKISYNRNTFRFRRFSRAAYAVFASLHRQVTIGTLNGIVADAQMRKSAAEELFLMQNSNVCDNINGLCEESSANETDTLNMQILILVSAIISFYTNVAECAACGSTDIRYIHLLT